MLLDSNPSWSSRHENQPGFVICKRQAGRDDHHRRHGRDRFPRIAQKRLTQDHVQHWRNHDETDSPHRTHREETFSETGEYSDHEEHDSYEWTNCQQCQPLRHDAVYRPSRAAGRRRRKSASAQFIVTTMHPR